MGNAPIALHLAPRRGNTRKRAGADEPESMGAGGNSAPALDVERAAPKSGGPQVWLISHHPEVINPLAPEYGVRFS